MRVTTPTLTCCNGTYRRDDAGWHYPWGTLVPGAADLTVADLRCIAEALEPGEPLPIGRPLTATERVWLAGDACVDPGTLTWNEWGATVQENVVGMQAPELHALTMMTVGDIAETTGVSKATIDSYRYRGYLPYPQLHRGRTPLWARPIVMRWLASRPGPEWQTVAPLPGPQQGSDSSQHIGAVSAGPGKLRGQLTGSTPGSA